MVSISHQVAWTVWGEYGKLQLENVFLPTEATKVVLTHYPGRLTVHIARQLETALCRYGKLQPENMFVHTKCPKEAYIVLMQSHGHLMVDTSHPVAGTEICKYGKLKLAKVFIPALASTKHYPGLLMVDLSPQELTTTLYT